MDKDKILGFIDYKFIPFSKKQCIKRLILIWMFNIPFYYINDFTFYIGIVFSVVNLIISIIFIYFILKASNKKESRFFCDGITTTYYAVLLNIAAFILLSHNKEYSILLFLMLLSFLLISFLLFSVMVFQCIKNDAYTGNNTGGGKFALFPFGSGLFGCLVARLLFSNTNDTQIGIIVLGLCLLFLSCIASIGSMSFVKILLLRNLKKQGLADSNKR